MVTLCLPTMTEKDQKYIKKGRRIYELFVSVEDPYNHVKNGKRGRDYIYNDQLMFLGAFLYELFRSFRAIQGFISGLLEDMGFKRSPYFTTFFRRIIKNKSLLEEAKRLITTNKRKNSILIIDGTGFSINYDSIYRVSKYRSRKRFMKLIIAVDQHGNVIDWKIGCEKLSEAKVAKEIIKRLKSKIFCGYRAQEDIDLLYYCQKNNINAIVKIRKNAKPKGFKQKLRKQLFEQQKNPEWNEITNYNMRTTVERTFSSIKRTRLGFVNSKKYHKTHLEWKLVFYFFLNNNMISIPKTVYF